MATAQNHSWCLQITVIVAHTAMFKSSKFMGS